MRRALLLILVLVTACAAHAASYYVDFDTGSNTNTGTAPENPWKHCPGDLNATGNAARSLAAGDTVFFKNDVTYVTGGITLANSGASGNPITYNGSTWGSGTRATITNNNSTVGATAFSVKNTVKSWLSWRGIRFYNMGGFAEDDPVWSDYVALASVDATANTVETSVPHGLSVGQEAYITQAVYGVGTGPTWAGGGMIGLEMTVKTVPTTTTFTAQYTDSNNVKHDVDITGGASGSMILWRKANPRFGCAIDVSKEVSQGGSGFVIDDCVFEEIGTWEGKAPLAGNQAVSGTAIATKNNRNIVITNCDFTKMKSAFSATCSATSIVGEILIQDCTFHNYMNWLIDFNHSVSGPIFQNITINRCTFRDYKEMDQTHWNERRGGGDAPHNNGIFMRTTGKASTWTNIVLKNSVFRSDDTSTGGGTASVFISQGPSIDIFNCLFLNDQHSNSYINVGYAKSTAFQQVRVWNCSFVGNGASQFKVSPNAADPNVIDVRNCAFYKTTTDSTAGGRLMNVGHGLIGTQTGNHNVYYTFATPPCVNWKDTSGVTPETLAQWQAATGVDADSFVADPLFTDVSGVASTMNLRPATGSPLIGAGENLSAYFTEDITGTPRPATGAWTIGAYAVASTGGEGTAPNAPTSLVATAASSTSITLVWFDTSSDETNFEVERSADGTTGWTQIGTPTAATYLDSGRTPSTTYYYRVRAVNTFGNSSYTSVANATTSATPANPSRTTEGTRYPRGRSFRK